MFVLGLWCTVPLVKLAYHALAGLLAFGVMMGGTELPWKPYTPTALESAVRFRGL